ncbi:MAG TPA: hypothetical protein VMM92_01690, partial [Thermoanaerobaculia bacterium]|nr:hypothetical protein [Thermoanaerobaculia bacterium]
MSDSTPRTAPGTEKPGSSPQEGAGAPPPRRRPGRWRRWFVRPVVWGFVLLMALLLGLYYLAGSELAHQRFTAFAITQTSDLLGRPVRIASLDYSLFPLSIELRGLVIPGPTPRDPAFATAELLRVHVPWRYLRRQVLRLDQIEAIRPTLYLEFRPDGTTNFPEIRRQGGKGQSRFQIQIGRLLVQSGEFRLNQRRVTLDIAARSIWARLTGPRTTHLDGLVTAQEVVTSLPNGRPYPVTVSAKVSLLAERSLLRIESARLAGADLRANASGSIGWHGATQIDLRCDATGDTRLVNHLGYLDSPLTGPFKLGAFFTMQGDVWRFGGTATAPRVDFLGRTATAAATRFAGDSRQVHVDIDKATYAQGAVKGKVDVDIAAVTKTGQPVDLALDFRGVSIADALLAEKFPIAGLSGEGSGHLSYRFNSSEALRGSGQGAVTLTGRYLADRPAAGLPVSGQVPLVYERGVLSSPSLQLTAPNQTATGTLSVDLPSRTGRLDFTLVSGDAGAVMRMIPGATEPPDFWRVTAGHGRAGGGLGFSPDGLVIDLDLDLADVRSPLPALAADTVQGHLRVAPRAVENLALDLTRGRGRLAVSGRIPIPGDRPKVPADDPLTLVVDAA